MSPLSTSFPRFVRRLGCLSGVALLGCSGSESTAPPTLAGCTGPVSVSVTSGATPSFSWAPACHVNYLAVYVPATDQEIWAIASLGQTNTIAPGITFGETPTGARLAQAPIALRAGTTYRMFIAFYHNGSEVDGGSITFSR